jgi:hypothetical protein
VKGGVPKFIVISHSAKVIKASGVRWEADLVDFGRKPFSPKSVLAKDFLQSFTHPVDSLHVGIRQHNQKLISRALTDDIRISQFTCDEIGKGFKGDAGIYTQ